LISEDLVAMDSNGLNCIGIDSKIDRTLCSTIVELEGASAVKRTVSPEHHLTFTAESGKRSGKYLTHRTVPNSGATGQYLAQETASVLSEYQSLESISAILVDNTAVNTGWQNGLLANLEKMLSRKLHLIGCSLHQNELPLRLIFSKLDGKSSGPESFTGELGRACSLDKHSYPNDLSHLS